MSGTEPPSSQSGAGKPGKETEESMKELKEIANVMISIVPKRYAVEGNRKVTGFRGKKFVEFAIGCDKKALADITDVPSAMRLGKRMLDAGLFHQSEESTENPKYWRPIPPRAARFGRDKTDRFVWDYEGSRTKVHLALAALIAVFFMVCLFPVWPMSLRVGAWYLSVTLLLLLVGFLLGRVLLYGFSWLFGFEFWFLPNVFDEELPVSESFTPILSFERAPPGQGLYRAAALAAIGALAYLVYTQPTEFDNFVVAQRQFIDDLYSGALLSDTSQHHKDTIDDIKERVDEILRQEDPQDYDDNHPTGDDLEGVELEYDEDGEPIIDEEALRDELLRELAEEAD